MTSLQDLQYNNLAKRILAHSDFNDDDGVRLYKWRSPFRNITRHTSTNAKILTFYKHLTNNLDTHYSEELVSRDEFIDILCTTATAAHICFEQEKQAAVFYTECYSSRSIYNWGNNISFSYIRDDYTGGSNPNNDPLPFSVNLESLNMYTYLWYPVTLLTHAPWMNPDNPIDSVFPQDVWHLGVGQNTILEDAGYHLKPRIIDIITPGTDTQSTLVQDICDRYEEYKIKSYRPLSYDFKPGDGYLFIPFSGLTHTTNFVVAITDKNERVRYLKIA